MIRAIFFDFGGVITDSPFEAFRRFENKNGLPINFVRTINSKNPNTNAWAQYERGEIDSEEFDRLFLVESKNCGYAIEGKKIIELLHGDIRNVMLDVVEKCKKKFITACLTNNIKETNRKNQSLLTNFEIAKDKFDFVVESSQIGIRKPEREFYAYACRLAGVQPSEVVFLDDLGINLKPARQMGMSTIKVTDPSQAIAELANITKSDFC